jgi:replicative DNA helicase
VFVDYLQLLRPVKAYDQRDRELGEMSRDLKTLAKELAIPVVALAVLNRALEKRPDKRPILSDLRESGSLEFDADVVLFLYRDEVYNPETEDKGIAEIIIGKQRNGPVGTVKAAWSRESTTFRDVPDASAGQRSFDDVPPPDSENP